MNCMCGNALDCVHHVWVALLRTGNAQEERFLHDWRVLPINALTRWFTNSDVYGCELIFWNCSERKFISFCCDPYYRGVYRKICTESDPTTVYIKLQLNAEQEMRMYRFVERQLGKPFNRTAVYLFLLYPMKTTGDEWFCSELITAALQQLGFLEDIMPSSVAPEFLRLLLQRLDEARLLRSTCESTMVNNVHKR